MSIKTPENPTFESLDMIQVKTPCQMDWELMSGSEQTRHCDRCQKNVYNISQMTQQEAISLIKEKEGNLCLRLFRRHDGTVVTADCPPMKRQSEASGEKRWFQFSVSSLMVLMMASAGLCASAPWIGKKILPYYEAWFGSNINGNFAATVVMGDCVLSPPPPVQISTVQVSTVPVGDSN